MYELNNSELELLWTSCESRFQGFHFFLIALMVRYFRRSVLKWAKIQLIHCSKCSRFRCFFFRPRLRSESFHAHLTESMLVTGSYCKKSKNSASFRSTCVWNPSLSHFQPVLRSPHHTRQHQSIQLDASFCRCQEARLEHENSEEDVSEWVVLQITSHLFGPIRLGLPSAHWSRNASADSR